MPPVGPISRRDLVRYLRQLGFDGPFPASGHALMQRGTITVRVPNPHRGDLSVNLLVRILRQAGVSREEWERL
jgi:predicted RNA binding protein YcfA (HicA-like mRNA interferase family)